MEELAGLLIVNKKAAEQEGKDGTKGKEDTGVKTLDAALNAIKKKVVVKRRAEDGELVEEDKYAWVRDRHAKVHGKKVIKKRIIKIVKKSWGKGGAPAVDAHAPTADGKTGTGSDGGKPAGGAPAADGKTGLGMGRLDKKPLKKGPGRPTG
jgi:hypothetical protein